MDRAAETPKLLEAWITVEKMNLVPVPQGPGKVHGGLSPRFFKSSLISMKIRVIR